MISIITPAYNNPNKLRKFLESVDVSRGSCPDDIEVIVIDDSSTVDLKSVIDSFHGVRYVRFEAHQGPAAARNRGLREARGEYLVFFDSDVVLGADTLKIFSEDFKRGDAAVVGEYDIKPLEDGFFERFKALLTESWTPKGRHVSVFALRAAGIRKDIFEKVGGFDENIKTASVEDFEFGDRLAGLGVPIVYDRAIIVKHHHPGFMKQIRLFYLRSRDYTEFFLKRGGKLDNWCASPTEGLGSVAGTIFCGSLGIGLVTHSQILITVALICLALYMAFNMNFIKVAYKRRGILFVPIALMVKLPLAVMITLGFAAGILQFVYGRVSRGRNS